MAKIVDIAKALATALTLNGFPEAEARAMPYMKREQLDGRKTVVTYRNVTYEEDARDDYYRVYELAIAVQGPLRPNENGVDDDVVEGFLDDVERLVELWGDDGPLRHTTIEDAEYVSGPEHITGSVFEHLLANDEHQFFSWTLVRYGQPA
jgi:hypothetical protein